MSIIVRIVFCMLLSCALVSGCKQTDDDPFAAEGFDAFGDSLGQLVEAYHYTVFEESAIKMGNPSLYIDFSSGIYQALSQPANKKFMDEVYGNVYSTGALDVYKLSRDSIIAVTGKDPTLVGKLVMDRNNYKDIYAPITKAVNEIVSKPNDAVLVTDFEEYYPPGGARTEILTVPYLKEPFIDWLSKGNTIHFFVSDYEENTVIKHLYFTIFSYGRVSSESLISRIEKLGAASALTRFDLSNKPFSILQGYDKQKTGGIFYDSAGKAEKEINVLDMQRDKYINGVTRSKTYFEFYPFGLDWQTIGQLKDEYNKQNRFKEFFRNIFIDISNKDSYQVDALSIKVSDVSKDFEQFAKCRVAAKHRPRIATGSNGEDKFDDAETDRIALTCYNPDGKIKDQWIYHAGPADGIPEVFTFNKTLFDNTAQSSGLKKAELAVSFDRNFSPKNIPSGARLLRVDIIVDKTTMPLANVGIDKLFTWTSAINKKTPNTALSASITNTLAEPRVKPDQKVIYSYYIKTLDN